MDNGVNAYKTKSISMSFITKFSNLIDSVLIAPILHLFLLLRFGSMLLKFEIMYFINVAIFNE